MSNISEIIVNGEMHCLQSCFRMVVKAFTGEDPGAAMADEITGYVEGRGTWQFKALLGFVRYGLTVIDHELFRAEEFVVNPVETIEKQVQNELVAAQIIAETDLEKEIAAVKKCMQSAYIEFIESSPTFSDITSEIQKGKLLICNINQKILLGEDGHAGHFVVVEKIEDTKVVYHDPHPPGVFKAEVSSELFAKAWTSPSASIANYIAVGKQ